jgi:hypothetical protein
MFPGHALILGALFFTFGWFGHDLRERRTTARKRSRALPTGTATTRKPGRPKKAPSAPAPDSGPTLPMD